MQEYDDDTYPVKLKKQPGGGANIAPGGPFDFSEAMDEDKNREDAMARHDRGIDNAVRTII